MDEQSLGKDLVHKVNKLTVVASESYKDFVTDLHTSEDHDLLPVSSSWYCHYA